LALEKLIKGLVFKKTKKHAPPIHDLNKLLKKTKISLSEKQKANFEEITKYNTSARYDNIKREFYKKANKKYTTLWFKKSKSLYKWLKNQY